MTTLSGKTELFSYRALTATMDVVGLYATRGAATGALNRKLRFAYRTSLRDIPFGEEAAFLKERRKDYRPITYTLMERVT